MSRKDNKKKREEEELLNPRERFQRQQARRQRRRTVTVLIAVAAVIAAAVGWNYFSAQRQDSQNQASSSQEQAGTTGAEVLHLSFPKLLISREAAEASSETENRAGISRQSEDSGANTSAQNEEKTEEAAESVSGVSTTDEESTDIADGSGADSGENRNAGSAEDASSDLTVDEFNEILDDLYERDYVLVDIHDVVKKEDSGYVRVSPELPDGKKPLIISERNVGYTSENSGGGYATGLRVRGNSLVNTAADSDGDSLTGAYDVVTCVDAFVKKHPDFSFHGAKGILAVTGYEGVLGYDSTETSACSEVVSALKEDGWTFASGTYSGISYGSDAEIVRSDADKWEKNVQPLVGDTDILILPEKADIGPESGYDASDERLTYLCGLGFRIFCADSGENTALLQLGENYARQGIREIDSLSDYRSLMT